MNQSLVWIVYKILKYLSEGKVTEADLTISKTIELLAKKEGKKNGYGKYVWANSSVFEGHWKDN